MYGLGGAGRNGVQVFVNVQAPVVVGGFQAMVGHGRPWSAMVGHDWHMVGIGGGYFYTQSMLELCRRHLFGSGESRNHGQGGGIELEKNLQAVLPGGTPPGYRVLL